MKNGRSGRCLRAMAMALALMIAGLGAVAESAALDVDAAGLEGDAWVDTSAAVDEDSDAVYGEAPDYDGGAAASDEETSHNDGGDIASDGEEMAAGVADEADDTNGGSVTLTITAVGDCTFSGEVGSKSNKRFLQCVEEYGYDYFFQNVRQLFESDDLTIVNLEGPLTNSDKAKQHGYVFKADPECVKILTDSSVELCNLANNHSLDYGTEGLKDTARVLQENGVGYCGFTEAWNATIKGVRVTALGFTKWDNTDEEVYRMVSEARENCDLLIVNMHWGWERQHKQCEAQEYMGRLAIDAGADLVIGTHPHVYQGIEKYKGRYIVYSLGNFCFAGNANPKDKRCLIFQQTFSFNPGMGIAQANFMDAGINIIPCSISSVTDKNDFMPTIMPAEQGAALLKAVAESSTHFSWSGSKWMKDNYLVANGLVKQQEDELPKPEGLAD